MTKSHILTLAFSLIVLSSTASAQGSRIQYKSVLCDQPEKLILEFNGPFRSPPKDNLILTTWNVKKFENKAALKDFEKISIDSDIVLVQEGLHDTEIEKILTETSDKQFNFFKSFCTNSQATGVLAATRFTQTATQNLVSKDKEPITNTPKVTGYSLIEYKGQKIHLLNTHGLNFNTGGAFERQMNQVAEFIKTLQGPVIWAGDFNTWSGGRTEHLMKKTKELGLMHLVPTNDNRSLKLDHIFVRGLKASQVLLRQENTSDHLPIEAVLNLDTVQQ